MQSKAWWLDRKKHKFISVVEHVRAVRANPGLYRCDKDTVGVTHHVGDAKYSPEYWREHLIREVCKKDFTRIRHTVNRDTSTLGWQFWGDPESSLFDLRSFIKKQEVGPVTIITFTDFSADPRIATVRGITEEFLGDVEQLVDLTEAWRRRDIPFIPAED